MKKFVIITLCALLAFPVPLVWASPDGFEYRLSDQSTASVTRYSGSDTDLLIPSSLVGQPVTAIDDWAFSYQETFNSITLPAGIVRIGDFAFAGCEALSSIAVEEENPAFLSADGVLFDKSMTTLLAYPGGKSGSAYTLPLGIMFIGPGAFAACGQLEEVNLPEEVVSIRESAFEDCWRPRKIRLPETLTQIEAGAFRYCSALASLFIPRSVRQIDFSAFEGCDALELKGPEGSWGQAYAAANNIPFLVSDGDESDAGGLSADEPQAQSGVSSANSGIDTESFYACLSDWITGSNWGVRSGILDPDSRTLILLLPTGDLETLNTQDLADIEEAMLDMLSLYLPTREIAAGFEIICRAKGEEPLSQEAETIGIGWTPPDKIETETAYDDAALSSSGEGKTRENLIFIHHSVGENWLKEGMAKLLNERGYHVADITYGWRDYGDYTDTTDWPIWFRDEVMRLVYRELGTMSADNSMGPVQGENRIILFKSCYPNSDVGDAITDEMAIYNSLLPYFQSRPDKMFILATPPPMTYISTPGLTRQLCRWLTDREGGWLAGLESGNVFVFDLYNVLTHPDAHHRLENGQEVHAEVQGADTLYYDWDGDNHPSPQGSRKAAEEFVLLLDHWYSDYID